MNKETKGIFDVLWYIVVFGFIQAAFTFGASIVKTLMSGSFSLLQFWGNVGSVGSDGKWMSLVTVLSSMTTILLFSRLKWTKVSNVYLKSKPWLVMVWTVLLSIGLILPLQWLDERLQLTLPDNYAQLFDSILKEPWGYAAVGLFAPLAEEVVFRGAILRKLLELFGTNRRWIAIAISALLFGLIHGNLAQGSNAFLIGLLLGWLYYRTGSILPGVAYHWCSNTIAYLMYHFMPQMSDGKLIDLFHGDEKVMIGGLLFSLCMVLPSLLQLNLHLKKAE